MSTIKETALAAVGGRVPRGMGAKAQVAVDALVAREQAMFEDIVEAGVGLGASRDQVHGILTEAGMHAPEQVSLSETDDLRLIGRAIDELRTTVSRLVGFARGHGYTG